jgi:hypothetical protein
MEYDLIVDTINNINTEDVDDPYNNDTQLSEFTLTSPIFSNSIIDLIRLKYDIDETSIDILKFGYLDDSILLNTDDEEITDVTGIEPVHIGEIKKSKCWTNTIKNSPISSRNPDELFPTIIELSKLNIKPKDTVFLTTSDIREKIQDDDPQFEVSDELLTSLIDSTKLAYPRESYFYQTLSSIGLRDDVITNFRNRGIYSFNDLRINDSLSMALDEVIVGDDARKNLIRYDNLEYITDNFDLANELIKDKIISSYDVATTPVNDFKNKYDKLEDKDKLMRIHERAIEITLNSFLSTSWAALALENSGVNRMLPNNKETVILIQNLLKGEK